MSSTSSLYDPYDPNSIIPALQHATSGSIGTLFSTCALYPLSLVITRLQLQKDLGNEAKSSAAQRRQSRLAREAAATAAARWAAREDSANGSPDAPPGATHSRHHPRRYQQSEYDGIFDAFSKIYSSEGGLKALYAGLVSLESP